MTHKRGYILGSDGFEETPEQVLRAPVKLVLLGVETIQELLGFLGVEHRWVRGEQNLGGRNREFRVKLQP
ncbi:hypothetical protein [Micrococcoides hystricis]|uniref:Uncharacterized protein n=1 Tax=Micrococcoides hystricis TaxID=1572761 RepID=A0ABV6P830_9MICC